SLEQALGSNRYERFLAVSKIFRCDCIQSRRCGVMLAERKKWKLVNKLLAESLRNGPGKFLFPSRCSWQSPAISCFQFRQRPRANRGKPQQLRQLSMTRTPWFWLGKQVTPAPTGKFSGSSSEFARAGMSKFGLNNSAGRSLPRRVKVSTQVFTSWPSNARIQS